MVTVRASRVKFKKIGCVVAIRERPLSKLLIHTLRF